MVDLKQVDIFGPFEISDPPLELALGVGSHEDRLSEGDLTFLLSDAASN